MSTSSSKVWKYFDKVENRNETKCKICAVKLKFNSSSTGAMVNHLKLKHGHTLEKSADENEHKEGKASTSTDIRTFFSRPCDVNKSKKITKLISEVLYKDLVPIKLVESTSFKNLIHFLEPNYKMPSRKAITAFIEKDYEESKSKLKAELKSENVRKVSVTTDNWTSINTDSFITITCHYIYTDNTWSLKSAVLATRFVEATHTAENLKGIIEDILEEFEISDKVVACVHDNAANINLAIKNASIFKYNICCSAHTLQLSVNAGLKNAKIQKVIAAGSKLVRHFKQSYKATAALKTKQRQLGLPQHKLIQSVVTRWNSVHDMFSRLLEQRWAVTAVLGDKTVTKLSDAKILELKDEDWKVIEQMCRVLEPLKTATETLSGETYVSASVICAVLFTLVNKYLVIDETDSNLITAFKSAVSEDIKSRYSELFPSEAKSVHSVQISFLLLAGFLDPRHKRLPFIKSASLMSKIQDQIRIEVEALKETDGTIDIDMRAEHVTKKTKTSFFGNDYDYGTTSNPAINRDVVDEVTLYISMPIEHIDEQNPLIWWQKAQDVLPNLSKLALTFLCVPSSSVAAERMFSSAGRLLNKLRSSLSGKHVDQILFLNKNN